MTPGLADNKSNVSRETLGILLKYKSIPTDNSVRFATCS